VVLAEYLTKRELVQFFEKQSEPMQVLHYAKVSAAVQDLCANLTKGKIVFDIDDTVLFKHRDVSFRIEDMFVLYKHAVSVGCEIYFITARINNRVNVRRTRDTLWRLGFRDYNGLFLMQQPKIHESELDFLRSVSEFKYQIRKLTIGYPIAYNIGNRWQDLLTPRFMPYISESDEKGCFCFPGIEEDVGLCLKLPSKHHHIGTHVSQTHSGLQDVIPKTVTSQPVSLSSPILASPALASPVLISPAPATSSFRTPVFAPSPPHAHNNAMF
jgi:hypothetical protein